MSNKKSIVKPKVLNLSKHKLTQNQVTLLARGPKFCPTTVGNATEFCGDTYAFGRRLELREIFFDTPSNDNSVIRKPSHKYISSKNKELTDITATIRKLEPSKTHTPSNISIEEETALRELKSLTKTSIEIKKADKTNTLVIMDKTDYRDKLVHKCHLQTDSYESVNENIDKKVHRNMKKLCDKHKDCLTKKEKDAILNDDWATSKFYVLPKINKSSTIINTIREIQSEYIEMPMPDDLKSRPIVSGPKSVTGGLSKLLEKLLTPLVGQLNSYIKDERDFLRKFPKSIEEDSYIICCDVVSLYTSIPNDLGIQAIEYWVDQLRSLIPSRFTKEFILEGISFVLENNYFDFDTGTWRQKTGTAMGKEVASPYACLTVGFLEETLLFPKILPRRYGIFIAERIRNKFFRFVDDGITGIPRIILANEFQECMNEMHSAIQWTVTEPSPETLRGKPADCNIFLSLKVFMTEDGDIYTDIFYKETNSHDYLSYDSHHPQHVKDNIPYVLAKNIIVSTSDGEMMETNLCDLEGWLQKCGYPLNIIKRGVFNARLQGPAPAPTNKPTIPLITTHFSNYNSSNIVEVARNLLENSMNPRLQTVFKDVNIIHSRRQPPNLLRQLTNAAFIDGPPKRNPGIHKCGRRNCKMCQLYLQECTSFMTANGKMWEVRCEITCGSKNTLYYQVCSFCNIESKCGKTDDFRYRTNNHITGARHGLGTDKLDNHIHECSKIHKVPHTEPFFKLFGFMEVNDYSKLRNIERKLHLAGVDTINRPQRSGK